MFVDEKESSSAASSESLSVPKFIICVTTCHEADDVVFFIHAQPYTSAPRTYYTAMGRFIKYTTLINKMILTLINKRLFQKVNKKSESSHTFYETAISGYDAA